jgi:hypothetical protein
MEGPLPGGTTFLIVVSPAPGKYEVGNLVSYFHSSFTVNTALKKQNLNHGFVEFRRVIYSSFDKVNVMHNYSGF